jgi:hypothetical protein
VRLDIQIIAAGSPQAKGRVERNHGTQQDRLVKKLRRLAISEASRANVFVETRHRADHTARFAQAPGSVEDSHRRAPSRTPRPARPIAPAKTIRGAGIRIPTSASWPCVGPKTAEEIYGRPGKLQGEFPPRRQAIT